MTKRSLFSLSFTALLAAFLAIGSPLLRVATADQPTAAVLNQEKPAKIAATAEPVVAKKPVPPVLEMTMRKPFMVYRDSRNLPAKPVDAVRLFETDSVFKRFTDDAKLTAWPIGEFSVGALPKNEAAFRQVLCAHAAQIGADYVVLFTGIDEIDRNFPVTMNQQFYGAKAYRRVTARLGIKCDEAAAKKKTTKISGFLPESRAEESGLRVGDIVKKVDGVSADDVQYWCKAIRWKVGDKVKTEIERDGKTVELEVELTAG